MQRFPANYVFLRGLAKLDSQVNGWFDLANEWMVDFEGLFEVEEADENNVVDVEDVDDIYDVRLDIFDEGIGCDGVWVSKTKLNVEEVVQRNKAFCFISAYVEIKTPKKYFLCEACYVAYADECSPNEVEHEHVMLHHNTIAEEAYEPKIICCSCRQLITVLILTEACIICNSL